ncbi:MAG: excinuclease ABC subunit UvrC [Chloroflexi bacterium]|nr:excinuclease ABC subunit UvrC [Chloroflexota bacterium]
MEQKIEEIWKNLPTKPGVYLMKDGAGVILYVGKAASLRHRVRSYFGAPQTLSHKLERLMARVANIDFIITDSVQEALLLESNLIKSHRPHYNVRLKDDKNYPYLKITINEYWPRVCITRRMEDDGARYFGPYASAKSVRKTLELIKRLFPYPSCNRNITGTDARACLDYYIHRCVAPCIGVATKEECREIIDQVILFLEGKLEQVVWELRRKMESAAEALEFERASVLRDQLQAVEKVTEQQKVISTAREDEDVIAFASNKDEAHVQVFFIRGGKLGGHEHYVLEGIQDESPSVIMTSFVKQFYTSAPSLPPRILLQHPVEDMAVTTRWLENKKGATVKLLVPRRGEKKKLVDMAAKNAEELLQQYQVQRWANAHQITTALEELQEQLFLPGLPRRIECYDISDIQGAAAVGSMVVFAEGRPKPAHYRRFMIKTVSAANDYAMVQEVLRRRFKRSGGFKVDLRDETSTWAIMPDLILIDGGRGQLNAALEVTQELGLNSVAVASLAKEREELFRPQRTEPIILPRNSPALYMVQRIRDEAHRFALSYHLKVRKRQAMISSLDGVPGIGPKRKRALLQRFGSVKGIKEASVEELASVAGMSKALGQKLKEHI